MKYKWAAALAVLLGAFVFHVPAAFAHFPATDKKMTVILHVDPDDQPVASQPAKVNFIYQDQLGKFNNQKCDCRVTIYEHGKQLFSGLATADKSSNVYGGSLPYTFKKPDVYAIGLSGTPKESGDFEPFKVSWNIRVEANLAASPNNEKFYIIGFIIIMLIIASTIGYLIYHDFKDA